MRGPVLLCRRWGKHLVRVFVVLGGEDGGVGIPADVSVVQGIDLPPSRHVELGILALGNVSPVLDSDLPVRDVIGSASALLSSVQLHFST